MPRRKAAAAPTPGQRHARSTTNVDQHVGRRIRELRTLLGLSQTQLGEKLNITFQQIQKYERGSNRVGASRLWDMARVLGRPVDFFFIGLDPSIAATAPAETVERDPLVRRETLELVRAYYGCKSEGTRKSLRDLILAIAGRSEAEIEGAADLLLAAEPPMPPPEPPPRQRAQPAPAPVEKALALAAAAPESITAPPAFIAFRTLRRKKRAKPAAAPAAPAAPKKKEPAPKRKYGFERGARKARRNHRTSTRQGSRP